MIVCFYIELWPSQFNISSFYMSPYEGRINFLKNPPDFSSFLFLFLTLAMVCSRFQWAPRSWTTCSAAALHGTEDPARGVSALPRRHPAGNGPASDASAREQPQQQTRALSLHLRPQVPCFFVTCKGRRLKSQSIERAGLGPRGQVMPLSPVTELLLQQGLCCSLLCLHPARALCAAVAALQIHAVLSEKRALFGPESPFEPPTSLGAAVGSIGNAGLGQVLKAGAFADLPGGFMPGVLSWAAPMCLPSMQTWAGSSCRARHMQDLVPGHRGSGPGLGKANGTGKQW